jgi:hypothetical protein
MFARLADLQAPEKIEKGFIAMPTQATSNGKSSQPKAKAKSAAAASSRAGQARSFAETAVDLPVGAVLELGDRVAELVEPFTGRTVAEKQLQSYRARLRRTVKRTERRGTSARRRATVEARKTRNRVERAARQRRRTVETTLKRNRNEVEQRVRKVSEQLAALR